MVDAPLLSIIILLPLINCLFVMVARENELQNAKLSAICGSSVVLLTSIALFCVFDFSKDTVQLIEEYNWIPSYSIKYKLGVDRYSIFFILMISIVSFLSMMWILKKNIHKTKHFFISTLLLESFSIGAFASYDLFVLVFFVEASMFPIFIMMHTAGKDKSKKAIEQFIAYGMASAICVLTAMLIIQNENGTSDIIELCKKGVVENKVGFWLLLIGTAVKVPMFPLHHWLPRVHVESPTVCSVFLASIVLKFSSLIIFRIIQPIFHNELAQYFNFIEAICLTGIVISCAHLFFQNDLKRFFAYFSILHMNLYFLILLSGIGVKFFVYSVLYHSFIMSILFFATDIIKTVFRTRDVEELKKVSFHLMRAKKLMLAGVLCLIGIPLSWGFVTEVVSVYATSKISMSCMMITIASIFTSSTRVFYVYQTIFGAWNTNTINSLDMFHISNVSKNMVLYTLFAIILSVGVFVTIFL